MNDGVDPQATATWTQATMVSEYLAMSPKKRAESYIDTLTAHRQTGVAQRTIQHWIAWEAIPAFRLGRRWLIRKESLIEFLQAANLPQSNECEKADAVSHDAENRSHSKA